MNARASAHREQRKVDWVKQGDGVPKPPMLEADRIPFTKEEYDQRPHAARRGLPAVRERSARATGWTLETQRERLGNLWANFARVATTNPFAWITTEPTPEMIASRARPIGCGVPIHEVARANLPVDMGASYVMTSYENALALGVARDLMVFPQSGADANDHWFSLRTPEPRPIPRHGCTLERVERVRH